MTEPLRNWAGNVEFGALAIHEPASVEQLQEIVAGSRRVRALGTRHSFSKIADTDGDLVSLARLPQTIEVDGPGSTVTLGGAVRYGDAARELHARGMALHNLGSLPHISVAGACATGTHGSGQANGVLATSVVALELVGADGELRTLDRSSGGDALDAAAVGLGAFGVVTRVTLSTEPTFEVDQLVYEDMPAAASDRDLDEILSAGYSVSIFTTWQSPCYDQVWVKRRVDGRVAGPEQRWMGAQLADGPRHPIPGMSPEHCTEQMGRPGPWHERLPHFRLDHVPSNGDELQSEYIVPRAAALDALRSLGSVGDLVAPLLHISEIRTIRSDELWLSPAHRRDALGIHFTWKNDETAVLVALAEVERCLAPYEPRPHWGKLFTTDPEDVARLYPRSGDAVRAMDTADPDGKFRNAMLDRYLPSQRRPRLEETEQ